MDISGKILSLLRLAKDQCSTPEGMTARRLAEALMEKHGISEDDITEDENTKDVEQDWIVQTEEPVAWMEMLLVTLCDLIYGGMVLPMQGPNTWRLYIVSDRGTVDTEGLTEHFHMLHDEIEDLLADEGVPEDTMSYTLGAVYGITEMLYQYLHGRKPTAEQMPFMFDKALAEAPKTGLERQIEEANLVFQPKQAAPRKTDDAVEILPNWDVFAKGRRAAHQHIDVDAFLLE